jgi:choline kinase
MLQGDKGAAKLLYKYQANVQSVPCQAAKYDIDTNEDLQQAEQLYAQQRQQKPFTTNNNSHCDNLEPV